MKQIVQRTLAQDGQLRSCWDRIARQIWRRVSGFVALFLCTARLAFGADTGNPPQLTQVSPASGVVGDKVAIDGENLATTMKVEFNGVSTQFILHTLLPGSDIWGIYADVPAGAATGPINVTTSYGTATTADSFIVLPAAPPTIDSFSPPSGPPGTTTYLSGQNLKYATNVLLNGVAMAWTTSIDPVNVQLLAIVPTNATTGPITVSSPSGSFTSTTNFTVTPEPPLTVAWPTWLEAGFKDRVYVYDETPQVTDVRLNGLPLPFTLSLYQVNIDIPLNAKSGSMTLFTPAGSVSSPTPIPVYPYPVFNRFEPDGGPGGTTVTVLGQNLDVVTQMQIISLDGNGGSPVNVDRIDSGRISFVVPDYSRSGEVIAITRKDNTVDTGLHFVVPMGIITTRPGTISGVVPDSDPTPITSITKAPPRLETILAREELPSLNDSTGVQPLILSIVSAGPNALKLSWPRNGPACVLESTDGSLGNSWMPLSPIPNENELAVPRVGKQHFFRLRVFSD